MGRDPADICNLPLFGLIQDLACTMLFHVPGSCYDSNNSMLNCRFVRVSPCAKGPLYNSFQIKESTIGSGSIQRPQSCAVIPNPGN